MASNHTQDSEPMGVDESRPLSNGSSHSELYRPTYQTSHQNRFVDRLATPHKPSLRVKECTNDTIILRNRRTGFTKRAEVSLELMGEGKVAKHKLDEVHWSVPSSAKSTLIMTFSPDGHRVASTHGDHRIYICDLNTGKLLDTLEGHPKTPWCLAWHPTNNDIIASGCLAGEVRVWHLKSKACESWTSENNTIITSISFHPRDRFLVIATANNIHFWDWSEPVSFAMITTPHDKERVRFVEFDSSGTKLITGISNFTRLTAYSSDSLQNRIIDSYLTQRALDQIPADNMTQNSEIANHLNGPLDSNDIFNERTTTRSPPPIQQIPGFRNGEDNLISSITLTLFRIACLYRNLESLEDSMRHTTFSPFNTSNPSSNSILNDQDRARPETQRGEAQKLPRRSENETPKQDQPEARGSDQVNSQPNQLGQSHQPNLEQIPINRPIPTPNAYEPLVVLFDELLETIQLNPINLRGRTIDLASVLERNTVNSPNNLNFMMRFESINQANQNFIRISKLMSSVRLYRQVIQQILSNNSGRGVYQPNQILTAQSSSPGSPRQASQLPIVFRNLVPNLGINNIRPNRSLDPILAIQFRNSARNVPLAAVCKVDLLSARSLCMTRSQQNLEHCLIGRSESNSADLNRELALILLNHFRSQSGESSNANDDDSEEQMIIEPFFSLLGHLQRVLSMINHAPLSTSNVHTHIASLRNLLDKLLTKFYLMLQTREEGRRLVNLVHEISRSLTGRSWTTPLGATLDDLKLDVIHTFSMIDLTLHLARQVQLLQMQRVSAIARIKECQYSLSNEQSQSTSLQSDSVGPASYNSGEPTSNPSQPSSSRENINNIPPGKRMNPGLSSTSDVASKRARVESNSSTQMIDFASNPVIDASVAEPARTQSSELFDERRQSQIMSASQSINPQPNSERTASDSVQTLEPNVQRLLLTSAPGNFYLLMRIFHRIHNNEAGAIPPFINEQPTERLNPPFEVRRRALSQENSTLSEHVDNQIPSHNVQPRPRTIYVNHSTPGSQGSILDIWTRPHLHIWIPHHRGHNILWMAPSPTASSNYRLQCWDFSIETIPNITDPQSNVITHRCRIDNDSSIDISRDGSLIACFVPDDDSRQPLISSYELKIISLKSRDFGTCYYSLPQGSQAHTVSISPSSKYIVVGLGSGRPPLITSEQDDDLTIAKVYSLNERHSFGLIRDIKIKRDGSLLNLNAIKWMPRGIVYNVGQGSMYHQRYQTRRFNHG